MTPEEIAAAITYANQIDPRVQMTDANLEVWSVGLSAIKAQNVRWAINQHYANGNANGEGVHVVNPASIRRKITEAQNTHERKQRALEPPKNKAVRVGDFRKRNPELYDELYQQGREQFYTDLNRRGIPATPPWETNQATLNEGGHSFAQGGGQ